ncbi:hypothetical protein RclHR1_00570020 [Rhizophagus clarus]|uniref:High mobility group box domain-containing protein n=1 Tax=Rhizophagus clarus TaxID=94130 RepID=A0A2Z6RPJ8_9GLOM|nr:hypothetical protein RclHR1_00570020 [Rhizophagus clarus]GET04213.1 high mobility group box domain-containing protein [Rhizophagus clarus]
MMNIINESPDPNKVILFDFGKTGEEIIKNSRYRFNMDPFKLIKNSKTTRRARRNQRKGINKAPRRQNPWILYRRDKSREFQGQKSSRISKEISLMWKKEPKETKDLFEVLSKMAEAIHEMEYKDYKYIPSPPKKDTRRSKKNNNQNESYEEIINFLPSPPPSTIDVKASPLMLPSSPPSLTPPTPTDTKVLPPTIMSPSPTPVPTPMSPSPSLTEDFPILSSPPITPFAFFPTNITTSPIIASESENLYLLSSPSLTDDFSIPSSEQTFFSFFEEEICSTTDTTTATAMTTTATTDAQFCPIHPEHPDWILF